MGKQRTLSDLVRGMQSEVSWYKREAERRALVASETAVSTSRIAAMVEQEKHLAVHEKMKEWADKFNTYLDDHSEDSHV